MCDNLPYVLCPVISIAFATGMAVRDMKFRVRDQTAAIS